MNAGTIIETLNDLGVRLEYEAEDRLTIEAPAGTMASVKELVLPYKKEILQTLKSWEVMTVYMEIYAGRLWLSTRERIRGIPLSPAQLSGTAPPDAQAVGAAIAWLLLQEGR